MYIFGFFVYSLKIVGQLYIVIRIGWLVICGLVIRGPPFVYYIKMSIEVNSVQQIVAGLAWAITLHYPIDDAIG